MLVKELKKKLENFDDDSHIHCQFSGTKTGAFLITFDLLEFGPNSAPVFVASHHEIEHLSLDIFKSNQPTGDIL